MINQDLPCVSITGTPKSRKVRSKMTKNKSTSPNGISKPNREREIEGQRAIAEILYSSIARNKNQTSGWEKFKRIFWRTILVFLALYGTFTLIWVLEIHFKCRIPYSEKSESVSFFTGQNRLLEFTKTEPDFLTYTPGLACFPYDSVASDMEILHEMVILCINQVSKSVAPISMGLI